MENGFLYDLLVVVASINIYAMILPLMRTKLLLLFFTTTVAFSSHVFAQKGRAITDALVLSMLKNFYTHYIGEFANHNPRTLQINLEALQQQNCTRSLLDSITKKTKSGDLDFDPFLKAQDSDPTLLKTLIVKKNPNGKNNYVVAYIDIPRKQKFVIYLTVSVEKNNMVKIASVW